MPLYQIREINPHVYLGLWKITENTEDLHLLLNTLIKDNQLVIPTFSSVMRQQQWLASRVLAYTLKKKFNSEPVTLETLASGKPEFSESPLRVSISHCRNLAAVLLSNKYEVGIDIEFISPKVMRVRDKFMSEAEKTDAGNDLEKTLICWSGKETLYKLYNKKQLIFKEHLLIMPFKKNRAGIVKAQIITPDFQKGYHLHYEILDQHILTYTLDF